MFRVNANITPGIRRIQTSRRYFSNTHIPPRYFCCPNIRSKIIEIMHMFRVQIVIISRNTVNAKNARRQEDMDDLIFCLLSMEIEDLYKEMEFGRKLHLFDDNEDYFDKYREIGNPLSNINYDSMLEELVLKFWGGKVRNAITPNVNYIVTQSNDRKRWEVMLSKVILDNDFQIIDKTFICNQIINDDN